MKTLLIFLTFLVFGCKQEGLTDTELLNIATSAYEKDIKMNTTESLGIYKGIEVKAIYPCGDLCPNYTTRVIHYSIDLEHCSNDLGSIKEIKVFRGIASQKEKFCIPLIISENWEKVVL